MVTIAASRAWAVSTLRWCSWMSHLLTVDAHLGVAARLRYLDKGAELLPPSRSSSRPGCWQARSTSDGITAGLRITVVANPQGTIAPLALRNQLSFQWNVLGPLKGAYQQYPWHSSRRPDVDRCIGGWAGATKVMARSLGRAMSTLVVQERHLWLCLVDIGTPTKFGSSRFLAPVDWR